MASPFRFGRHGGSGQWVSELFPRVAGVIDEIALIRSMQADSNNHAPALFQMNTGRTRPGHPSVGAWVNYGLGSARRDLPGFVVLADDRGGPIGGAPNWGAGYLPGSFAGTPIRGGPEPIVDLAPPPGLSRERQRADRALLEALDRDHVEARPAEARLRDRIASYELAFRMQTEAPDAVSLDRESAETKRLYGLDDPTTASFGRRLLIARRLVERGVRFVQVYYGRGGNFDDLNWDAHNNLAANHRTHARATDGPTAALIVDLKRRGLLDRTLVAWGGEFGRMPVSQARVGRDHNPHGFTAWLAGGGVRGGVAVGSTDDFGLRAVESPCHVNDWHRDDPPPARDRSSGAHLPPRRPQRPPHRRRRPANSRGVAFVMRGRSQRDRRGSNTDDADGAESGMERDLSADDADGRGWGTGNRVNEGESSEKRVWGMVRFWSRLVTHLPHPDMNPKLVLSPSASIRDICG